MGWSKYKHGLQTNYHMCSDHHTLFHSCIEVLRHTKKETATWLRVSRFISSPIAAAPRNAYTPLSFLISSFTHE